MSNIRQVILETLSQRGSLPIDELARATRHSALATRYHLTLLIDAGLVAADQVDHQATVGRPQVLYALAEGAHEHLPKQYNWLAEQLLKEIGDSLGAKEKRVLMRRAGKRIAASASPLRRGARIETRLKRAADFLTDHGYITRWEKTSGGHALHVCNCPYRQVSLQHREVCDMDMALVAGLIETPLKMTVCIANNDSRCSFIVKSNDARTKK